MDFNLDFLNNLPGWAIPAIVIIALIYYFLKKRK